MTKLKCDWSITLFKQVCPYTFSGLQGNFCSTEGCLVGCYIMSRTVFVPPFQRKILPPSSADRIRSGGFSGN